MTICCCKVIFKNLNNIYNRKCPSQSTFPTYNFEIALLNLIGKKEKYIQIKKRFLLLLLIKPTKIRISHGKSQPQPCLIICTANKMLILLSSLVVTMWSGRVACSTKGRNHDQMKPITSPFFFASDWSQNEHWPSFDH